MKMKKWYDKEEDIFNIQLKDGKYWKSIEIDDKVIFDISEDGSILSLEVLKASEVFSGDVKKVITAAN